MKVATLKTCRYCGAEGFVWYRTNAGAWALAKPKPNSLEPNPFQVHLCQRKRDPVHQRSYKASTWRRGKSPGSYR